MKVLRSRKGLVAVVAAGVAFGLIGCGAGGGSAPSEGEVRDSIVLVQTAEIPSLNMNIASQRTSSRVAGEISEAAVKIKYDGNTPEMVPGLAESWEMIDEHTWEFKVRPNVTFTNGEELTAEDFKNTLEYYREDPGGKITTIMNNTEIEVIDDETFHVITEEPNYGALPVQMTWMAIMPSDYRGDLSEAEFGDAPIGTGPYKLKEWKRGVSIELEANEDYWGGAPEIKSVTIQTVPDAATRVGMLETGAADIVADITPDLADRVEAIEGVDLKWGDSDSRSMLVLNSNTPPTDDPLVRQAINHAIDKESLVDSLFKGHAKAISGVTVDGELGHDPDFQGYEYDPEKARELLAEAGYPDGNIDVDLNYTIGTSLQDEKVAEALEAMLSEVGFNVAMKGGAFATLQPTWREPGASSGIYTMSYGPVYPDQGFLFNKAYFHPEAVYGEIWTETDEELTRISDDALTTADPETRDELYREANQRVMDLALWVPMFNYENGYGVVEGLDWEPYTDNRLYFEYASFD